MIPNKPHAAVSSSRKTATILLVDDEDWLREIVARKLRQKLYTVLEADNGQMALRIAEGHPSPIDFLLVDLKMPTMNGREVFERLRTTHPETEAIFMSGFPRDHAVAEGWIFGNEGFIEKSLWSSDLAKRVEGFLARLLAERV
jgi:response regulator RpfG family c-di-GMP phosphodiesterase